MKKIITTLFSVFLAFWAQSSFASDITAIDLQKSCNQINKGAIGQEFDKQQAQFCNGYMAAFVDNFIILDRVSKKRQICIPKSLPTSQNTLILDAWIKRNKKIAGQTTAAVALFSAFKKAFPCN